MAGVHGSGVAFRYSAQFGAYAFEILGLGVVMHVRCANDRHLRGVK